MLPTTTMMGYSMSKTMTGAAVLQIIEAQGVDLDEPIGRFVDISPYGQEVTIRRLLAHTAGVPNPIPLAWIHGPSEHRVFDERQALSARLRRYPRLSFPPGAKYRYSNIGYWLLGELVERLSGVRFSTYVTEHVLKPLGIAPAELGYEIPDLSEHAHGYLEKYSLLNLLKRMLLDERFIGPYRGRWLEIYPHYLDGAAFGGLIGTARGFSKFLRDQLRRHSVLFGERMRSQFYTQQRTNSGKAVPTSLGWQVGTSDLAPLYYKEGGGGGFHCMMRLYPVVGLGTVLMTNATVFNVGTLLDRLDSALVGSYGTIGSRNLAT
jgi:D-alanyl-D-alanine carboxypeptidase